MEFKETQAIYLQIVDFVCEHIATGKWKDGERMPSVRELGIRLEVNPNTIMRAYDCLQNQEIIYNKRGVGYFIRENASSTILRARRIEFIHTELPDIFRRMTVLDIPIGDVVKEYEKYSQNHQS